MLWEKLTNEQKYVYSQGLYDFIHNSPMPHEPVVFINELTAFYWLGYRDMEQIFHEGLANTLTTNVQVYNYCN